MSEYKIISRYEQRFIGSRMGGKEGSTRIRRRKSNIRKKLADIVEEVAPLLLLWYISLNKTFKTPHPHPSELVFSPSNERYYWISCPQQDNIMRSVTKAYII